jgi:hypothetical protein
MKLKNAKTCDGCRAYEGYKGNLSCSLHYSNTLTGEPLEPCPKPKTYDQLINCNPLRKSKA